MSSLSSGSSDRPRISPQESINQYSTTSTVIGPPGIRHAHYMGLSGAALQAAIGMAAGLSFLAFGYGQGDIGGIMLVENFREMFPQIDAMSDPTNLSLVTLTGTVIGSWNLGCLAGAVFTFFLCNMLGRKYCIVVGLGVEIIGKIIQCSSFSLGQYIAGRVVSGVGNGFIASSVPAWQAECLKTQRRGTILLVSFGGCITLGIALSYWISYGFSWIHTLSVSWRFPVAFSILILTPALIMIAFLPESPRYLLLCGKEKEALNVLSALEELPPDHEDVRREVLLIKNTVLKLASGSSFSGMFSMGKERNLHRVLLAVMLQLFQQFTGINLFIQFLGSMFGSQLGYPDQIALLLSATCATWYFITSMISIIGIDHYFGRRALTIFGASGMCGCMIVLCGMSYLSTQASHHAMSAFLYLYVAFFSIGWQGMSWLWAVEIIPLSIRGPANALATAVNWLANFCVVVTCPPMFTNITYKTYATYAVINFVIIPSIYFFYPETGSRSLEEVDLIFESATAQGNPWFSVVNVAKQEPRWYDAGEKTEAYSSSGSGQSTEPYSVTARPTKASGPLNSGFSDSSA